MRIRFSRHALEEISYRSLPESLVTQVLETPDQVAPAQFGRMVYQSKLAFPDGKVYLLRVVVEPRQGELFVVTAYRTTRLAKYWVRQ